MLRRQSSSSRPVIPHELLQGFAVRFVMLLRKDRASSSPPVAAGLHFCLLEAKNYVCTGNVKYGILGSVHQTNTHFPSLYGASSQ